MDELELWQDTLLIVNTDHGFLLGEHDCWAKVWTPWYQELANIPFFVWDPRCGKRNERRQALVQTIDLAPTILEFFGLQPPPDMTGQPLRDAIASDTPVREAGIFGVFGGQVNVTDGRHVYMRAAADPTAPLFEHTQMPTRMRGPFTVAELAEIALAEPFPFTKGCRTMKIRGGPWMKGMITGQTQLWDVAADPRQERPVQDAGLEQTMIDHLVREMRACDAPPEQFARLGL